MYALTRAHGHGPNSRQRDRCWLPRRRACFFCPAPTGQRGRLQSVACALHVASDRPSDLVWDSFPVPHPIAHFFSFGMHSSSGVLTLVFMSQFLCTFCVQCSRVSTRSRA
jgi:hypothetical protein